MPEPCRYAMCQARVSKRCTATLQSPKFIQPRNKTRLQRLVNAHALNVLLDAIDDFLFTHVFLEFWPENRQETRCMSAGGLQLTNGLRRGE